MEGIRKRAGDQATVEFTEGYVIADAVTLAKSADVAIVFLDNDSSETEDREDIRLNEGQNELMSAVADANNHAITVLNTGAPVVMHWEKNVPAIMEMWYPGMEDGNATAALLFGDINPSGKLPMTFAKERDDYTVNTVEQYPGVGGSAEYSEGVFLGYRHFDENGIEPLFPLGHGLSYTNFKYSNLSVTPQMVNPNDIDVMVRIDVTNIGNRAGKEVVQTYIADHEASVDRPPKELKAFEKVALNPGETTTVELTLGEDALSYYDTDEDDWVIESGEFSVVVGQSSRDIHSVEQFEVV